MNKYDYDMDIQNAQNAREAVIAQAEKTKELQENKNAVQERFINLIKEVAGWTEIDNWATQALDKIKKNQPVDLVQLDADIVAWKNSQTGN